MIFNLKVFSLDFSSKEVKKFKAIFGDLSKIIDPKAEAMMDFYRSLGEVLLIEQKQKYDAHYLAIVPKENGKFMFRLNGIESLEWMKQKTLGNAKAQEVIGILSNEQFSQLHEVAPVSKWVTEGLRWVTGLLEKNEKSFISLKESKFVFQMQRFINRSIVAGGGLRHDYDPSYRYDSTVFVFGALNPYRYYLFSLLDEIKNI